jgi:glutathione synthase/RimK-type ligase-like ATP-grasp enzyme
VVSVQIDSHNLDFREDINARPLLTPLPKPMQDLSRKICTGLGMHWCAIDWRKNTKGEYYFLEANPCPFFLFVENETGVDITGRLVKLLTT